MDREGPGGFLATTERGWSEKDEIESPACYIQ